MTSSASSLEPLLSPEPVIGWRVWRLEREGDSLSLVSVMTQERWPAREAMRATCNRGANHSSPDADCTCGIYAAASPEALAHARVTSPGTTVVGAIAMWGTVVEHARGTRSSLAYPARLRIVCGPCLAAGSGAVAPAVVVPAGSSLIGMCRPHLLTRPGLAMSAGKVQQELLATYAVEPIPMERISRTLRTRTQSAGVTLASAVASVVLGLVKFLIGAIMTIFLLSMFLTFVVGLLGAVFGVFTHEPEEPDAPPSPVATYVDVLADAVPGEFDPTPHLREPHRVPIPDTSIICGIGQGGFVELANCWRPEAGLLGFAWREPPNGVQHDCPRPRTAYTKSAHFWICWIDLGNELVYPRPSARNPWTVPKEEGGVLDGDR